ncbi:hypothetical protein K6W16_22155 [Burkholderia dolosa]|uniref:Uncharacterized protein n=1 Tax=Burkholderia dolosa TaxID=152500 RepID=A0A892I952_9BURK|nr:MULTISPECIES: hypothetical protein [Burkholderia]MBR8420613.1 hypothetical protein [Burkholderia dolosa]MBY4657726.1 hypothetical protein [Burkholderia dolosa]MBY4690879.1 hypothetical protein [Burkholderia dolosa]MBY4784395.1 hypothetical protein [Burkholderia dolosa]MBY4786360.1 hypothetical protein [Burkholderia dolosa]
MFSKAMVFVFGETARRIGHPASWRRRRDAMKMRRMRGESMPRITPPAIGRAPARAAFVEYFG